MNSATQDQTAPPVDRVVAPIDWGLAAATAQRLIRSGPAVPLAEAETAVRQLREFTPTAERHVRELTGLGAHLPLHTGEVVDRPGWVQAAIEGLAVLTDGDDPAASASGDENTGAENRPSAGKYLGGLVAGTTGVQAGMVLAFLSSRVLGQYDPFGPGPAKTGTTGADAAGGDAGEADAAGAGSAAGRLLLVAPNVVAVQQAMDVPADDFAMWVCLHECTHRLQFTAVPWLRDYFATEVRNLLAAMEEGVGPVTRLPELIRAARQRAAEGAGAGALVELLQSPEQRVVLDRLLALSTLLEGHADHVMDAVGPSVVPSVATIRNRFTARRRGGGLLDRVLRSVLGVEAKVRQYAEGAAFTGHVVDAVGMAGFNAVWQAPETLPTRAEITDPDAWLRRVHG
ncbi:zinc-dependent metalloprotease [Goodfellowiella coeruleoviolacea]|uniref:zinc-dependent metalloprotease n=1 Tax=Goodfellowiella coeruleoviolacea TaxID=334858 RepID=UPI0020A59C30|nr:zinc-dependent metalloprotease [Goodfellowiella coeruleoviolacea]